MATQEERSTRSRAAVLDAAVAVLVDGGLERFTTPAVAARAGLSQGSVFRHFPTKDDLVVAAASAALAAVVAEHQSEFLRRAAALTDPDVPAVIRLGIEQLWAGYCDPRMAVVNEIHLRARTDPALLARLEPITLAQQDALGVFSSLVVPDAFNLDPDEVTAQVVSAMLAMHGRSIVRIVTPDPEADRQLLDILTDSLVGRFHAAMAVERDPAIRANDPT